MNFNKNYIKMSSSSKLCVNGKLTTLHKFPSNSSVASLTNSRLGPPNRYGTIGDMDGVLGNNDLQYLETLMYGRYSAHLAGYARQLQEPSHVKSKARSRVQNEERIKDEMLFSKELDPVRGTVAKAIITFIRPIWDHTFARLGEDWVFLFFLGLCMSTFSFLIDYFVFICFKARMYLHQDVLIKIHWTLQMFAWVSIPCLLVVFSAAFCQWLAPSAAGSGIPEMKTILRGVMLKEYLTWKTLVAKIVGLAAVLGSGLPLGKEGPVMHMASIVSTMLMSLLKAIKGVVDNEAHSIDLLAAACTMGVSVCYAAPIGGVLFSIEVTTVYFAVRNYWRGFFAAVVGALFYRLMSVWFMGEETIYPLFKVEHNYQFPYDIIELMPFLCIGICCGFLGSLFVYLHRRYVIFVRQNKMLKKFLHRRRLFYPIIVTILISFSTYPLILGQFMASTTTTKQQILDLFSNVTWTVPAGQDMSVSQAKILSNWVLPPNPSFHISLFIFQVVTVIEIAIASTLPVPNGILIPLFKVGAAFGRQIGELMATLYPSGIHAGSNIVPGAYAMVGAASFCAAITHTISISVIVFELTGQITYVIPIMIGVLISNCISSLLQPSIYDSVIRIKKLPYLPDILTTTSDVYNIYVEDIMVRKVIYIWRGMTYMELKTSIKENLKRKVFPLVDKHDSMILLGSVRRYELVSILVAQISSDKRLAEAHRRRIEEARERLLREGDPRDLERVMKDWDNSSEEIDNNEENIFTKLSNRLSNHLPNTLSKSLSKLRNDWNHDDVNHGGDESSQNNFESCSSVPNFRIGSSQNHIKSCPLVSVPKFKIGGSDSSDGSFSDEEYSSASTTLERKGSRFSVTKVNGEHKKNARRKRNTKKYNSVDNNNEENELDNNTNVDEIDQDSNTLNKPVVNKKKRPSVTYESDVFKFPDDSNRLGGGRSREDSGENSIISTNSRSSRSNSSDTASFSNYSTIEAGSNSNLKKKSSLDLIKLPKNGKKPSFLNTLNALKPKIKLTRSNSLDSLRGASKRGSVDTRNSSTPSPTDKKNSTNGVTPRKGILKRRNSLSLDHLNVRSNSAQNNTENNYQTISVVDNKFLDKMRRMKQDMSAATSISQISLFRPKKNKKEVFDLTDEEKEIWELAELAKEVDFSQCQIDASPFQLVERTSLLRCHTLFSMLGINHAYVTTIGKLVGVVALKELRTAIEGQYMGKGGTPSSPQNEKTIGTPPVTKPSSSPQKLGFPVSKLDPEAGVVIRRSSSHLMPNNTSDA